MKWAHNQVCVKLSYKYKIIEQKMLSCFKNANRCAQGDVTVYK